MHEEVVDEETLASRANRNYRTGQPHSGCGFLCQAKADPNANTHAHSHGDTEAYDTDSYPDTHSNRDPDVHP